MQFHQIYIVFWGRVEDLSGLQDSDVQHVRHTEYWKATEMLQKAERPNSGYEDI